MATVKLIRSRVAAHPETGKPFGQKPGTIFECSEREAHALVTRKQGVLWDAKKDSELPKKNVESFLKATGKKLSDESKAQAEKLAKEKQRLAKIAEAASKSPANEALKADAAGDDGTGSESDSAGDSERPKPGN